MGGKILGAIGAALVLISTANAKVIEVPQPKPKNHPKVSTAITSPSLTIQIIVNAIPASISLPTTSFAGPPTNHGMKISNIVVTMVPSTSPFTGTVTLGGTNVSSFAVNGCPTACELDIGPNDLAAGNYSITLTANQ